MTGPSQQDQLRAALGNAAGELPVLDALSADQMATLIQLIEAARAQQGTALQAASEQALSHVPALLRGAVRKLLVP